MCCSPRQEHRGLPDPDPERPRADSSRRHRPRAFLATSCAGHSTARHGAVRPSPWRGHRESHRLVHPVTNQQLSGAEPAAAQNAVPLPEDREGFARWNVVTPLDVPVPKHGLPGNSKDDTWSRNRTTCEPIGYYRTSHPISPFYS